jgi:SPP1 gp7 family putative phage head morphogenesis protein
MLIRDMWHSFAGRNITEDTLDNALVRLAAKAAPDKQDGESAQASPDNPMMSGQAWPNPEQIIRDKGWPYILDMERNDKTLSGFLNTRQLSATQMDWQVAPGGPDPRDKEIAEFVRRSIDTLPGSFDDDLGKVWDAWRWGYSVVEEVWGPWSDSGVQGEKWNIVALKDKPPWTFEFVVDPYGNLESLVQKTFGHQVPLDPTKFIIGTYGARGWNPYGRGLVQECFLPDWFIRKGWQFWSQYIERYVGGVTIGSYPEGMKKAERDQFQKVVESLRTNAAVTIPEGATIQYLTAAAAGADAYKEFCHEQRLNMAFTITGSELSAMVGDSGSRALGDVHANVANRIISSDAKRLFGIMNDQYVRRIVMANYGNVPMPVLIPDTDTDLDREVLSKIVQDWHERGLSVSEEYLRREFEIDPPEEDETILTGRVVSVSPNVTETKGGAQDDQDDDTTRFAAAAPKRITNRPATVKYIDEQTTTLLEDAVEAGRVALIPARELLVQRGRQVWDSANLNASGRPKSDSIAVRPTLPMGDYAQVVENAIVGGLAIGLQSATDEMSTLGVSWPDSVQQFEMKSANTTYEALSAKTPVTRAEWDVMTQQARAVSLTVSGVTEAEIVSVYQQSLLTAVINGWGAEQWIAYIDDQMRGWTDTILGTAPGAQTEARLRTIFRSNIMRSTNEARINTFERPSSDPVSMYMYMAILDGRETALCRGLHAMIAPLSQWRSRALVPPNHYNCRSYLSPILESQVPAIPAEAITRRIPRSLQPLSGFGGDT